MLLVLASLNSALAASVAVVDFQALGVAYGDGVYAAEGVRTAILMAGDLELLSGSDVAAGVSASVESDLRSAREHAGEARRLYLLGDYDGSVAVAGEAVREHRAAFSQIGRGPELADAWYILGVASVKSGLMTDAAAAFSEVIALYPDYLTARASNVPGTARVMLEEAAQEAPGMDALTGEQITQVRAALRVDWVVTGSVDSGGEIVARLWGAGSDGPAASGPVRLYAEVQGNYVPVPVPEESDVYATIASAIARAAMAPVQPVADAVADAAAGTGQDAPAPVSADDEPMQERALTQKWWFWTSAAGLIGGGALVGYALWEPPAYVIPGPDTWSVRIDGL